MLKQQKKKCGFTFCPKHSMGTNKKNKPCMAEVPMFEYREYKNLIKYKTL